MASTAFGETVTTLLPTTAGGGSTTLKAYIALSDSGPRIFSAEGQKIVGRLTNTLAMSAITHNMYGVYYPSNVAARR